MLGLGPNLFYNSPMEACIVICHNNKPAERQGKVLFIDALNEVTRERSMSYLKPEHQGRIADTYHAFRGEPGFAHVANLDEIAVQDYSLSIPLYVKRNGAVREEQGEYETQSLRQLWQTWEQNGHQFWQRMDELVEMLDKQINKDVEDAQKND